MKKKKKDTNAESGGDFPGALNSFCSLNMGHGSSPVVKSTATQKSVTSRITHGY